MLWFLALLLIILIAFTSAQYARQSEPGSSHLCALGDPVACFLQDGLLWLPRRAELHMDYSAVSDARLD